MGFSGHQNTVIRVTKESKEALSVQHSYPCMYISAACVSTISQTYSMLTHNILCPLLCIMEGFGIFGILH